MPITLRHVQPDAGAKLRELETSAAELERAAREALPPELLPAPPPRHLHKLAVKTKAYGRIPVSFTRNARDRLKRTGKLVAGAVRATVGLVTETAFYVLLALGALGVLALLIMLLAPPA